MEIRQLSDADAAVYQKIRLFGLQESPTAFGSSYEEEIEQPLEDTEARLADGNNHVFGAFDDDGQLQGVVTLRRDPHHKSLHKAYVYAMYVAPPFRRQGLGRALMETAIARARELGLSWINLTVNDDNADAVGLYRSLGFETFGLEKDAFRIGPDSYDSAYMTLRLK